MNGENFYFFISISDLFMRNTEFKDQIDSHNKSIVPMDKNKYFEIWDLFKKYYLIWYIELSVAFYINDFQSKKKLDFNDFKLITTLIYQGKHLKPEIKNFILDVSYTMNNFRLTTFNKLSNNFNSLPLVAEPKVDKSKTVSDTLSTLPKYSIEPIELRPAWLAQLKTCADQYLNLPPVYVKTSPKGEKVV